MANDPKDGPDGGKNAAPAYDDPTDDYWPTGELKLSPTEMWMEHRAWPFREPRPRRSR